MSRFAGANRMVVTILVIGMATWFAGWWAVPIVALIAGLARIRPAVVAGGASLAWAALLAFDAMHASFANLTGLLSGIMGFPGFVLIILTLTFPALLAWSAGTIGTAIPDFRRGAGERN